MNGCKELQKAMQHAKEIGAVLVIAKSDRFRNCQEALGILTEMGEGNIEFCDLPHSDRFTLTLFWALAEREALITSIRTKQALSAKKARGEATGGASRKWIETFNNKSKEQIEKEYMEKGKVRNARHLENRDVKAFLKIIKNVFPNACKDDDAREWNWENINTKGENRMKILDLMRTHKELDESGNLFAKWDFSDIASKNMRVKLCSYIQSIRKSLMYNKSINQN